MTILFIHSHYGKPSPAYVAAADEGRLVIVRERDLTPADFAAATGLLTTTHLDQLGFMSFRQAVADLLARGGRWFFNGHIMRPFIEGLGIYVPLVKPKRADLSMVRLSDHPIFAGIDQSGLEENRGVAGFYGRGHNPLPAGATAVNGIGPERVAIDWDWAVPGGGRMFSHAGNDLGGMGAASGQDRLLVERMMSWTEGKL